MVLDALHVWAQEFLGVFSAAIEFLSGFDLRVNRPAQARAFLSNAPNVFPYCFVCSLFQEPYEGPMGPFMVEFGPCLWLL